MVDCTLTEEEEESRPDIVLDGVAPDPTYFWLELSPNSKPDIVLHSVAPDPT